ncbi:MAG: helix-turn-helix transcriptional regulator [Planctomycetaceae bacterium]|nr:helix-turn-helix transcriptional regulator [Planctomycetaceae bacterium]
MESPKIERYEENGRRIVASRKAAGYSSAAKLARAMGLKENRVRTWERGTRSPGILEFDKLSEVLGVSAQYLAGFTENPGLINPDFEKPTAAQEIAFAAIKDVTAGRENIELLTISDNSMDPILSKGDQVIVDKDSHLSSGAGCFALSVGDQIVVRELSLTTSGKVSLSWENSKHHDDMTVANLSELSIIGRVVWFARDL